GVELPGCASFTFHLTLSLPFHLRGKSFSKQKPCPVGPRQAGQLSAAADGAIARQASSRTVGRRMRFLKRFGRDAACYETGDRTSGALVKGPVPCFVAKGRLCFIAFAVFRSQILGDKKRRRPKPEGHRSVARPVDAPFVVPEQERAKAPSAPCVRRVPAAPSEPPPSWIKTPAAARGWLSDERGVNSSR